METSPVSVAPQKTMEDPLSYLPCSRIVEYKKGQIIYDQNRPPTSIYLIIEGKVKVCRLSHEGYQVVIDLYHREELFGESALLGLWQCSDQATALEKTNLMAWSADQIEELVVKRSKLAIALVQVLVERTIEFGHRIESFSLDNIACRLARSLIHFSERLGVREEDGSVRMMPFTHELLSQYVGSSREIVTQHMNQFRQRGYVRYSRKGIVIYADAFKEWLRQNM